MVYCAYYDLGGEGVAYHDNTATNQGSGALNPANGTYLNEFRMQEGVDVSYVKLHDDIDVMRHQTRQREHGRDQKRRCAGLRDSIEQPRDRYSEPG